MDWFGLGILLQARDNASGNIMAVNRSLTSLTSNLGATSRVAQSEIGNIQNSLASLSVDMMAGMGIQQMGQSMMGLSASIISPMVNMGKQALQTGDQFEKWGVTMEALYKSKDIAEQKMNWGLDLASSTPFEVKDVMEAVVGFKAIGAEADTIFKTGNQEARSFLEYMGDLAALRPDKGLDSVLKGVRNLFGGDGGYSLRQQLDIDLAQILGEEWEKTPQAIMDQLVRASDLVANGLMTKMEGTWSQMVSNLKDQGVRFAKAVADGGEEGAGTFDTMKNMLKGVFDMVSEIDNDKMKAIGTNVANGLNLVLKPVNAVIQGLTSMAKVVIKVVEQNPAVVKFIIAFISLLGGITAVGGALLIFGGIFLIAINGIKLFMIALSGVRTTLMFLGSSVASAIMTMGKLGLVGAGIYALWKSDFGGVRSVLQSFMQNIFTAFSYSESIANMSAGTMKQALEGLDTTTFGGWLTYQLVKIRVLWMALVDAWSDYTISDDLILKLRYLGLLPLLETILDVKMRAEAMFEGFKIGFSKVGEIVKKVASAICGAIEKVITFFNPVNDEIKGVIENTGKLDTEPWVKLGEVIGIIAGLLVVNKIGSMIFGIGGKILGMGKNVLTLGKNILMLPKNAFDLLSKGVYETHFKLLQAKEGIGKFATGLKNLPSKAINGVKEAFWKLDKGIADTKASFGKFTSGLKDIKTSAIDNVKSAFWKVDKAIIDVKNKGVEFGKTMVDKFRAVDKAVWEAKDKVISFGGSLITKVKTTVVDTMKQAWFNVKIGVGEAKSKVLEFTDNLGKMKTQAIQNMKTAWGEVKDGVNSAKLKVIEYKDKAKDLGAKAVNGLKTAWGGVKDNLNQAKDAMVGAKDWVVSLKDSAVVLTAKTWLMNAAQTAMNVVQGIWNALCAVNPAVWVVVGIMLLIGAIVLLWNKSEAFRDIVIGILEAIGGSLKWLWDNVLSPILSFVGDVFMTGFTGAFNIIKSVVGSVIDGITGYIEGIKRTLGGVIDFVTGVFTGNWERAFGGLRDIFGGIFDSMKSLALTPINAIIGAVNTMIRGLNNIDVDIPDWVPGLGGKSIGINIPEIPKLNTGGYIKSEGISMLHPNEVVINDPLTRKLQGFLEGEKDNKQAPQQPQVQVFNYGSNDKTPTPMERSLETPNRQEISNSISNSNVKNSSVDKSNKSESVDQSITFSEGAIQITMTDGNNTDINKLVKQIAEKLKKEQSLRSTLNYKPQLA